MKRIQGFTLTELAVVLAIVGLLLGGLLYTLSAQTESRNFAETQRRLEDARDLLIGFAVVNGRLPCPASTTSNGNESFATGSVTLGGGTCTNSLNGFLPAAAIGFRPVDDSGYALDVWGNRIRYSVAQTSVLPIPTTLTTNCTQPTSGFTDTAKLKANGIGCVPQDLVICSASQNTSGGTPTTTPPSCGTYGTTGDARPVTNQGTAVAVIFATGKNTTTSSGGAGTDEGENTDNDGVFVWHDLRPAGATGGEYDDQMVWIPIGMLYERLIAAGVLP